MIVYKYPAKTAVNEIPMTDELMQKQQEEILQSLKRTERSSSKMKGELFSIKTAAVALTAVVIASILGFAALLIASSTSEDTRYTTNRVSQHIADTYKVQQDPSSSVQVGNGIETENQE